MRRVILESPYAGDIEANVAYARECVRDSLLRGEAPIASHLLYTQPGILRDEVPEERTHGIDAGLAWGAVADATVVYMDRGMSRGMAAGIERAQREGRPVEQRWIRADPLSLTTPPLEPVVSNDPARAPAENVELLARSPLDVLDDLAARFWDDDHIYQPIRTAALRLRVRSLGEEPGRE